MPAGSLVVTNKVYDALLREDHEIICCGKVYHTSTEFDQNFVQTIKNVADKSMKEVNVVCGKYFFFNILIIRIIFNHFE